MKAIALVISCEHAVNTIPEGYQQLFAPHQELLQTHRGLDIGAEALASYLSQYYSCDCVQAKTTRLLIDCNRSLSHRHCFSLITALLPKEEKAQLVQQYYLPFRQQVEKNISKYIQEGKLVLHLSIHSFTPILNNKVRTTDIGLLYDPKRNTEKKLVGLWQKRLQRQSAALRVRRNYPYRGISDAFTTTLRKQFTDKDYAGLEVECNQALLGNTESISSLAFILASTLKALVNPF